MLPCPVSLIPQGCSTYSEQPHLRTQRACVCECVCECVCVRERERESWIDSGTHGRSPLIGCQGSQFKSMNVWAASSAPSIPTPLEGKAEEEGESGVTLWVCDKETVLPGGHIGHTGYIWLY